ncbi:MAG TPA: 3'-5' exonuclease, partial [Gaiellaceae bacterium]|nr:3'-5' exonuclease [Gaiellaceae bacterium]
MQLRLDAADRLVELVEERRRPVPAEEAARHLFALRNAPVGLARGLLADCVGADARLAWRGDLVALAAPAGAGAPLELASFVVVDLETTGLSAGRGARICEIGAVRVAELELTDRFQTLANPGTALGPAVERITGLRDAELRRAPPVAAAVRRFLAFAGDDVLVAHNARFDVSFLDRETERLTGRRVGSVVVD